MRAKFPVGIGLLASALLGVGIGAGLKRPGSLAGLGSLGSVASAQEPLSTARRTSAVTPDLLSFADVAEQVTPAVVLVKSERRLKVTERPDIRMPQGPFGEDWFERFFRMPPGDRQARGLGSGFVVDPKGVILTNNHVVDGADKITVRLADRREFEAKLVGTDPKTDIAVLRVEGAGNLPAVRLGDDKGLRVGEWVLAIGSPFNEQLEHTVTAGIISAKGRSYVGLADYEDYLQTDAAINPGNSGGPLVNLRGEVIGINSAIASRTGGFQGVGFAIPIGMAEDIMNELLDNGKVVRSWLGVTIQDLTPELAQGLQVDAATRGLVISDVAAQSPADRAGLQEEDVIVAMDGTPVGNVQQFRNRVARTRPGTTVKLEVLRDGKRRDFEARLEEKPEERTVASAGGGGDSASERDLGFEVANLTQDLAQRMNLSQRPGGVVITGVEADGLASEVGLRAGDVVRSVNRKRVSDVREFRAALERVGAKDPVVLLVRREDRSFYVTLDRDS
jgi:serine protease Do